MRSVVFVLIIILLFLLFCVLQYVPSYDASDAPIVTSLMEGLHERSQRLQSQIQERCHRVGISTKWDFSRNFVLPRRMIKKPSKQLLYSCNPKTGSSSFKKFLFMIDGDVDPRNVHLKNNEHYKEVKKRSGLGTIEEFDKSLRIVFIRNPLTRLVSAFRDKQLKFHRFLTPGKDYPVSAEPFHIFQIFLSKIMFTGQFNEDIHLQPQWHNLQVCTFPYTIIADYEHSRDYIELIQNKTETRNITYPGTESSRNIKGSSDGVTFSWIQQLDAETIRAIESAYELDFYVLGYSRWGEEGFPNLKSL